MEQLTMPEATSGRGEQVGERRWEFRRDVDASPSVAPTERPHDNGSALSTGPSRHGHRHRYVRGFLPTPDVRHPLARLV